VQDQEAIDFCLSAADGTIKNSEDVVLWIVERIKEQN
jgi:hypothetical protein